MAVCSGRAPYGLIREQDSGCAAAAGHARILIAEGGLEGRGGRMAG